MTAEELAERIEYFARWLWSRWAAHPFLTGCSFGLGWWIGVRL